VRAESTQDRVATATLLGACLFAYAYFFQGTGWNQNAHFDTVRAIVERGTFEITAYASNTGDVSRVGDKVYSNKPPGLALLAAPVYFALTRVESAFGFDVGSSRVTVANMHATTVWTSALPAALLAVGVYRAFRREGALSRMAFALACAFAFGSLLWPYSGVMMVQPLVASSLFWAWLIASDQHNVSRARLILAGLLAGLASLCDYLAAPLAFALAAYVGWTRRSALDLIASVIGPALAVAGVLLFNQLTFGNLLVTAHAFMDPYFKSGRLLFGQFDSPDYRALYWISYHPMRGLFVCCPMFMIPILSLLGAIGARRLNWTAGHFFRLVVVGYFVAFMLTFVGWTGGWGVGPRYLIPALPFLWLFARRGFERFGRISAMLIALSMFTMFAVTAVQAIYPANDSGPPQHWDPVGFAWLAILRGQVAKAPDSYNLGILIGLRGAWSLLPVAAAIAIAWTAAWLYLRPSPASAAAASGSISLAQSAYIPPEGCNPSATTSSVRERDGGVTST
jgi:hypothetical protein